jgi:hypothetical protein
LDNLSKVPNQTKKSIAWVSLESDETFTIKSSSFYPNVTSDAGMLKEVINYKYF